MTAKSKILSRNQKMWFVSNWCFLGILVATGLSVWILQIIQGMEVTSLNQQVVWGMYIAGFFTAAGLGAGLLTIIGLSEFTDLIPRPMRKKALSIALACFCSSGILITMDIGNIPQVWRLATAFQTSAPMTWDFWALLLAGGVAFFYLYLSHSEKSSPKLLKIMGLISIFSAIVLIAVEGIMLATTDARSFWMGGTTIFQFILSGLIMGLSFSLFLLEENTVKKVKPWLVAGLITSLVLITLEIISGLLLNSPEVFHHSQMLLFGQSSPFLWTYIILGLVLPILMFLRGSVKYYSIAGLICLGILAEKLSILITGQVHPLLPLSTETYFPNWVEFVATLGAAAFGFLSYKIILLVFPLVKLKSIKTYQRNS